MTGAEALAMGLNLLIAYRRFRDAGGRDEDKIPNSDLDTALQGLKDGDDELSAAIARAKAREAGGQ